jgi:ATP-dependent protease Clp ATPase subunit
MNAHKKPRGHKAHNDKDSILADTKNLLFILHPAVQRMPKIERIEGAPVAVVGLGRTQTVRDK